MKSVTLTTIHGMNCHLSYSPIMGWCVALSAEDGYNSTVATISGQHAEAFAHGCSLVIDNARITLLNPDVLDKALAFIADTEARMNEYFDSVEAGDI